MQPYHLIYVIFKYVGWEKSGRVPLQYCGGFVAEEAVTDTEM